MKKITNHPQIQQLLDGEQQVFELLYNSILPKVTAFVKNNRGQQEDADEVFQKALFQLIARAKIKGVQINSAFEAYVFTVCKNLWRKELNNRKREVRNETIMELKGAEDEFVTEILSQERWELFQEKILELSENCRALLKDYFSKVSYKVIIEKFNYSSENVAFQRIFKCKKKLTSLITSDSRYKDLTSL